MYTARVQEQIDAAGPSATVEKDKIDGETFYRIFKHGFPFSQVAYGKDGSYNGMLSHAFETPKFHDYELRMMPKSSAKLPHELCRLAGPKGWLEENLQALLDQNIALDYWFPVGACVELRDGDGQKDGRVFMRPSKNVLTAWNESSSRSPADWGMLELKG